MTCMSRSGSDLIATTRSRVTNAWIASKTQLVHRLRKTPPALEVWVQLIHEQKNYSRSIQRETLLNLYKYCSTCHTPVMIDDIFSSGLLNMPILPTELISRYSLSLAEIVEISIDVFRKH